MPNNSETLVRLKVGNLSDIGKDENTNAPIPEVEGGSILFGIYDDTSQTPTVTKGKILFDLPDGSQRIVMSTDAEYAQSANRANWANSASEANSLSGTFNIDGIRTDGTSNVIHYGVSSTAAATAIKTVDVGSNFILGVGSRVTVKYTVTNTADNPSLKVGTSDAKAIYYQGNPIDKKYLVAGEVHQYVYDGTYWLYVGTIADNVLIYVDEARETLFITTSLSSGDGVRY